MVDSFELRAGEARALFCAQGAECRRWRIGAREMLWPGDSVIWPAVAPVLFPTCGWSRAGHIRIGEIFYPMPVHGFAAQSLFHAQQRDEQTLRFTLHADDSTRVHYPFPFSLSVTYRLEDQALGVTFEVMNRGGSAMPYAVGLHPGFALNWGQGPHCFVFGADERAEVPVIAAGGLVSDQRRPVPLKGRTLDLSPALLRVEALCFLDVQSRVFALAGPQGRLCIDAPDFPHLVLWNRQGAPYLAIESWTGTGDLEGFTGSFFERPSMIQLAAGESRIHHVRYAWEPLGRGQASP
jgi:galactose mutarotase-like enzyme